MTTKNIRFQGLVKTTAEIESDKFDGRIGWNTTLARFVVYYNSTQYAQMARRDVLETFSQGIQDSTLGVGLPMFAGTAGRLSTESVANFRSRIGAVSKSGDTMTGNLTIGNGTGSPRLIQNAAAAATNGRTLQENGTPLWFDGYSSVDARYVIEVSGGDQPLSIVRALGSEITLGGSGGTKRDVNLTKDLKLAGTVRISSGGDGAFTTLGTTGLATLNSLKVTGQAGTGPRLVQAGADGTQSASIPVPTAYIQTLFDDADQAAARATLGAAASTEIDTRTQYAVSSTPGASEWTLGSFSVAKSKLEILGYVNGGPNVELRLYSGTELFYSATVAGGGLFHVKLELLTAAASDSAFVSMNGAAPTLVSMSGFGRVTDLSVRTFSATNFIVFRKVIN